MCKEDDNKALVGRWFKDFWLLPRWVTASGVPVNSGQSTTDERVAARSA